MDISSDALIGGRVDLRKGEISLARRRLASVLIPTYITLIFGTPIMVAVVLLAVASGHGLVTLSISALVLPWLLAITCAGMSGALSIPHHKGIIKGTFPKDTGHPIYFHRRLYGLCWTSLYYNKPLYWLCLSCQPLKTLVFRLYGYRGSIEFTIYPDSWIRDLPLLNIGHGAYIANRATLGTNVVKPDGTIMVDSIIIGKRTVIGHLCVLAPGNVLGDGVEVGASATFGYRNQIGAKSKIGAKSTIEHGVKIGENCDIQNCSRIASASRIGDNARLPFGYLAGPKARIESQGLFKREQHE